MSLGVMPRVIATCRGAAPGPTLILIGGVHGNEPAGVEVARDAVAALTAAGGVARGEVVALVGNVRGLAARRRYLARDLNRLWTSDRLGGLAEVGVDATLDGAEVSEMIELAAELDAVIARATGPVYALDLHTTSAPGIPFGVAGASPGSRQLAAAFPMPSIVGLEELLDGVLTRYLGERGVVTLAVEGGQTGSDEAARFLAAVVTIALTAVGLVDGDVGPASPVAAARARLAAARGELPRVVEVVVRHAVRPEHGFAMRPGFTNLQPTAAGTILADDRNGEIRAPFDGVLLLPLYQPQGADGFFFGRPHDR